MNKLNKELKLKLPKAILFDTDNTLYDYHPANKVAEEAVYQKAKNLLGIKRDVFYNLYKQAKLDIKSNLHDTASSHSRLLYFQRLIELLGYKAQLLLALDFEQTFWRTFLDNAPLFPGVLETLNYLKNIKIPIAIVTDLTSHIQLRKLTYFELEDMFDAVVTSEEVGKDKPYKKNFLLVLNKLNLPENAYFWMIGDNPKADIFGAKQLGASTFQKIHNKVQIGRGEFQPDYTFSEYSNFLSTIKDIIVTEKKIH